MVNEQKLEDGIKKFESSMTTMTKLELDQFSYRKMKIE